MAFRQDEIMERLMIKKSDELLRQFFLALSPNERMHVGLMGGWAVHYLLKREGKEHMGSRDIDIFIDPHTIKEKTLFEHLKKLGFQPHSTFRWSKFFHSETEQELSGEESKKHPSHNISPVFFDIATPVKTKHSMPEPLLKKVYAGQKETFSLSGVNVMVPSPKILVEMKLGSSIERPDPFKRAKDLVDLYNLLDCFSDLWAVNNNERIKVKNIPAKKIKKFKAKLDQFRTDGTLNDAATLARNTPARMYSLFQKM
ncbi:MAG: hypothetical protein V1777_03965 [Candidatus Micrarchaeota archaeon]